MKCFQIFTFEDFEKPFKLVLDQPPCANLDIFGTLFPPNDSNFILYGKSGEVQLWQKPKKNEMKSLHSLK